MSHNMGIKVRLRKYLAMGNKMSYKAAPSKNQSKMTDSMARRAKSKDSLTFRNVKKKRNTPSSGRGVGY